MKIVKPKIQIPTAALGTTYTVSQILARCARECYQSEHIHTQEDSNRLLAKIIRMGHESVLEHEKVTMRATCDRGVSHEMVRHRIASYSQESQRYCDYKKKGDLEYIAPIGFANWSKRAQQAWINGNTHSEESYFELRDAGVAPQDARDVLTNAFTTHVILTLNWRSLRNMLRLRSAAAAHPKYRQLAIPTLRFFKSHPATEVLVHDIPFDEHFPEAEYAEVELTNPLFEVAK